MSRQRHCGGEQPTAAEDPPGQGQPALPQGHRAIHRGGRCAGRLHLLCEQLGMSCVCVCACVRACVHVHVCVCVCVSGYVCGVLVFRSVVCMG